MKIIFKPDGVMWIIDQSGTHEDVTGCTSIVVPHGFVPVAKEIKHENGLTVVYKTLAQVSAEVNV
jgi:hypothetical protein